MRNTTQQDIDKNAQKDHRDKLIFEGALFLTLFSVFNSYSKTYRRTLAKNGGIAPTHILHGDIKKHLVDHYSKVSDKFSTRIVDEIGKPRNHEEILKSIKNNTDIHNQLRATDSSSVIVNTTAKDANRAFHETVQEAIANKETLSHKQIADRAQLKLDAKIRGRMNTISITETQNPAENAKQSEIDLLDHHEAEIDGENIQETVNTKMWIAILDNVTRDAHALADGQIVSVNEPYLVGGENLMYPGDFSLGATIGNIINCRCSSQIIIKSF